MIFKRFVQLVLLCGLVFFICMTTVFGYTGEPPIVYIPFDNGFDAVSDLSLSVTSSDALVYNYTGAVGNAVYMNDGFIMFNFSGRDDLSSLTNMTIALWYNRNTTTDEGFMSYAGASTYDGVELFFNDVSLNDRIQTTVNGGSFTSTSGSNYPANVSNWNFLIITFSNTPTTCIRYYRNGVSQVGSTCTITTLYETGVTDFVIGYARSNLGTTNQYTGLIDEFMIFDYTLNSTQAQELWENPYTLASETANTTNTTNTTILTLTPNGTVNVTLVDDPFDAWNVTAVLQGEQTCPLDEGRTDRLFYIFVIILTVAFLIFAFTIDNAIIGIISGFLLLYVGFVSLGCDLFLAGMMILLSFIVFYLSATQLSVTQT